MTEWIAIRLYEMVNVASAPAADHGLSWEEQKRRRNRLASLPARRDRLLADIASAEARRAAITAMYAEPGFFQRTAATEVEALEHESATLAAKIDVAMAEWEAVETELASGC